ncbi:MAG: GGDEF domain-containing protein [Actinomycetota bacterium]|nr:GGDEF domain-containing protein [Actinomycetota bacterium]
MIHIRRWWRQPDRYDWLSEYLASRRLLGFSRALMAVVVAVLAVAATLMPVSPAGGQAVALAAAAYFAGLAVFYAVRWPSRGQSAVFSLVGSVAIAVVALTPADPHAGLLTCWGFVGLAAYVASFHSSRLLVLTVGVALGTMVACAVRTWLTGDPALGVATLLLSSGALMTVPFGGQILVRLLWNDAVSTDPMTNLANRRGFRRSSRALISQAVRRGAVSFSVVLIDLDGFKRLNDTRGHAVGDQVIVEVAARIREVSGPGVIAARIGGEEFVVAQATQPREVELLARRLCSAIAATRWGVTASLGIAGVTVTDAAGDIGALVERVVANADMAMYEAKRAGGNQIRQSTAAA